MKSIDLNQELKNLRDEPVLEQDGKTPATLRYICCSALITPVNASADDKFQRMSLAIRFRDAGVEVTVTEEERKLIRDCIGQAYSQPEIVHGAWQLLDAPEPVTSAGTLTGKQTTAPKKKAKK